jgi:hypothetical protein
MQLTNIQLLEYESSLSLSLSIFLTFAFCLTRTTKQKNMVLYYQSKHADLPKPYLIYVGKDKFENEDLIRWSWPEQDVWFHVDDLSSAHVYLRLHDGETIDSIPEKVLLDCAQLVKYNSIEGNKREKVDVVYTPCENLLKKKSFEVGQVAYKDEKLVLKTRIRDGRNNDIVNRLNKTKKEVEKPDLEGEKLKRDLRIKKEKQKFYEQQEKERREKEEEIKADLLARDYGRLDIDEKKVTNKELSQKYESYEEAEEDFM